MPRAAAAILVLLAVLVPRIVQAAGAAAATPISGGGSGFAALEIDQWHADVARPPYNLKVDYSSQGSGVGRGNFANKLFDFGASDIVYPPPEQATLASTIRCGRPLSTCFKYVPVSAGGLGFMYNLVDSSGNRIRDLKLTRDEVCKIFTGQIVDWTDPELVATNPKLSNIGGPDHIIRPVVRSDSAGESYVLSEFCIAVAPAVWNTFKSSLLPNHTDLVPDPGLALGQPVSVWPTGLMNGQGRGITVPVFGSGSDEEANAVIEPSSGANRIAYNAAGYAKVRDFPVASVENAASVFTQPTETNVTVALGYATGRGDGTFILNFTGPDARAYFPSTYSYILAQTVGFDPGKATTLSVFLCYAVGAGQVIAPSLAYARLSSEIVAISVSAINQIAGGTQCVPNGPPPPPPIPVAPGSTGGASGGASGPKAGSSTLTTTHSVTSGGATSVGSSATTSSTAAGSANPTDALNSAGATVGPSALAALGGASSNTPKSGPTGAEALWALTEGAALCAVGLVIAGARSKGAP